MRFRVIKICFFVFFVIILLRLAFWQIIMVDDLTARAESQRTSIQEVEPERGSILFSDGSLLVSSQPTFRVFFQPRTIKDQIGFIEDPDNTQKVSFSESKVNTYRTLMAHAIAEIVYQDEVRPENTPEEVKKIELEILEKKFMELLRKDLYWVSSGKKVSLEAKTKIERLDYIGVGFEPTYTRFYPEGSSSAHLLGFIAKDSYGVDTGYYGLEGFYNGELKGKKGILNVEKDALGLPILIGRFNSKDPVTGKILVLNIDRTIQHIAERSLAKGMESYGAKNGSVIIMDPKTGNILAMASYPSYDPADAFRFPRELYRNPITADGYEPGSTFKVLVAAAAINEKVITPDTICNICAGPVSLSGFIIRTWNNQYRANANMTDVIVHSDNTGMVFISRKLGLEKLYDYIEKFGFGKITNIDLQDEQSPDLRPEDDWKEIDQATASFGQGISVSALQILRAVGAIANGGKMMEPHVVAGIKDERGGTFKINPRQIGQPVSPEAAKVVTEMMVQAVEQGEAQFVKAKGFRVAGKTGTAQIPIAGHYDPNKTIASFVGFAPADNPRFVMLVRYAEPTSSIFGAETAAPTFFDIAKQLLTYYGISPTEQSEK